MYLFGHFNLQTIIVAYIFILNIYSEINKRYIFLIDLCLESLFQKFRRWVELFLQQGRAIRI